ncbi:hypothetical protein A2T76_21015 [Pseudomonas brenneri]|nr:hypothetical protein A2T76_21015 [Pseudomonas brenneri]
MNRTRAFPHHSSQRFIRRGGETSGQQLLKLFVRERIQLEYATLPARDSRLSDVKQLRGMGLFDPV